MEHDGYVQHSRYKPYFDTLAPFRGICGRTVHAGRAAARLPHENHGRRRLRSAFSALPVSTPFLIRALFGAVVLSAFPGRANASEVSIAQLPLHLKMHRVHPGTPPRSKNTDVPPAAMERMVADAANAHGIPVNFFHRLIQQESGFNPNSVSSAGAEGVAQFMPGTASERGLKNPFDPAEALPKSAEFLSELSTHFGNLGLAAAAYNAGEERVRKWLAGESRLPQETINYVRAITGHDAAEWVRSSGLTINLRHDFHRPAAQIRKSWEAQFLAALRAAPVGASGPEMNASIGQLMKPTRARGEAALCSQCIMQKIY
jgi:hypothetical protein